MATKNRMGVVVAAEDKVTGEMRKAAKAYVKFQTDVEGSDKKVTVSTTKKTKAINTSTTALKRFKNAAKLGAAALGVIAAGAALAVKKIFDLASAAADLGDQAFVMADRLGVSSEFITRLGFAARQVGSSIGSAEKGLKTLEKQALSGSITFTRWGVSARDAQGKIKPAERLFLDVAERIKSMGSATEQSAAAQDIFGRAGLELLPLLRSGRAGFKEFADEADRLGVTISTADAIIANRFNNQLQALRDQMQASSRVTGAVFLPILTETFVAGQQLIIDFTGKVKTNEKALQGMARRGVIFLADAVIVGVKAFDTLIGIFNQVRIAWNATTQALTEGLAKALDLLPGNSELVQRLRQHYIDMGVAADQANDEIRKGEQTRKKLVSDVIEVVETFQTTIRKGVDLDNQSTTTNTNNSRTKVNNILNQTDAQKKLNAAKKEQARIDREEMARVQRVIAAKQAARAMTKKADEKTLENQKKFAEDQKLLDAERTQEIAQQASEAASFLVTNFEQAFSGVFDGTKKLSAAFEDLFKSIALSLLRSGILKLLGGLIGAIIGGPAGLIGGLGPVFGVKNLITGTTQAGVAGFQEGGEVPGRPTPGRDSVLIGAEPGEVVLSRKAVSLFRRMLTGRSSSPGIQRFQEGGMVQGGSGGLTANIFTRVETPAPDLAQIVRVTRDGTLQALKELQHTGELSLALRGAI